MLYRWPQGRVLRTIFVVLAVAIAVDLVWHGVLGQYEAYSRDGHTTALVGTILFGVLAAVVFIGGIAAIGFVPKTAGFLIEVEREMAQVTWPGRSDIVRATIMITIMTVILAAFIFVIDYLLKMGVYDGLFQLGRGG